MKIKSNFIRRSVALATGVLFAVGSMAVTMQSAVAASAVLKGQVNIEPRDLNAAFGAYLNFGFVKVGQSGGTISLTNDGSHGFSVMGDVVHVSEGYEGQLAIQGEKGETVTITLDETFTMAAQNQTGAADLVVTTAGQGSTYTLQAENGVRNTYQIGGTLTIPANQPADTYRGEYTATVNYQ